MKQLEVQWALMGSITIYMYVIKIETSQLSHDWWLGCSGLGVSGRGFQENRYIVSWGWGIRRGTSHYSNVELNWLGRKVNGERIKLNHFSYNLNNFHLINSLYAIFVYNYLLEDKYQHIIYYTRCCVITS